MAMNGNGLNGSLKHISGNEAELWTPAGIGSAIARPASPEVELAEEANRLNVSVRVSRRNKIKGVTLTFIDRGVKLEIKSVKQFRQIASKLNEISYQWGRQEAEI